VQGSWALPPSPFYTLMKTFILIFLLGVCISCASAQDSTPTPTPSPTPSEVTIDMPPSTDTSGLYDQVNSQTPILLEIRQLLSWMCGLMLVMLTVHMFKEVK
jgi:hypothetical protein